MVEVFRARDSQRQGLMAQTLRGTNDSTYLCSSRSCHSLCILGYPLNVEIRIDVTRSSKSLFHLTVRLTGLLPRISSSDCT